MCMTLLKEKKGRAKKEMLNINNHNKKRISNIVLVTIERFQLWISEKKKNNNNCSVVRSASVSSGSIVNLYIYFYMTDMNASGIFQSKTKLLFGQPTHAMNIN